MISQGIQDILIDPETTIKEAIKIINQGSKQIALVINISNQLIGTVTDGDIRRAILNDFDLQAEVAKIMTRDFFALAHNVSKEEIINAFKQKADHLHQIPLVDEQGHIVDIVMLSDIINNTKRDNYVVLMAGGLGTRLRPLTSDTPKPLLNVGDKPLLEIIINQFQSFGYYRFIIAVNYGSEQIKEYFGDGSKWGIQITYLKEEKRLGTAGALSLIEQKIDKPLIVMNGDLLTKLDFNSMLKFHQREDFWLTIGSRKYTYTVPFGVIDVEKNEVQSLKEKPAYSAFINAGVYVLNPEILEFIPYNQFFDMTDLINKLMSQKKKIGAFPIHEYWLDIGQHDDYQRANNEYWDVFI